MPELMSRIAFERVEQHRETACNSRLETEQATVFDHADELPEPFVELEYQEVIERGAGRVEPVERRARQVSDAAVAQLQRQRVRCRSLPFLLRSHLPLVGR